MCSPSKEIRIYEASLEKGLNTCSEKIDGHQQTLESEKNKKQNQKTKNALVNLA